MDKLQRPFGFWTATALVVGGMIGSGIFALPSQVAPFGWTGVVAWMAAIAGAMLLAWTLAGLAAARPDATGVVAICADALGPLAGVLVGWAYWVGVWSANAFIALTAARYLGYFWPALVATPLTTVATAVVVIWAITLLNLDGARTAGRFQVLTTALKLLPLAAIVVLLLGFTLAGGGQFRQEAHPAFEWSQLTPALTLVFFALVGFEGASIAAERVRDPARNVVRATLAGVALTGMLYIIVCTGIVLAMPGAAIANANAPVALFVQTYWGEGAGLLVAAFAAIATIGCLNGWVLVQGEVPLGMARAGVLPRWIARTNRRDVPVAVILLSSTLATVLVLSNANRATGALYDFMLRITTAATLWLYLGACLSALVLGVRRAAAGLGLAFGLWALWGAGLEAVAWSVALMLTALPLYWTTRRPLAFAPAEG